MKIEVRISIILSIFLTFSCVQSEKNALEQVLAIAGKNRKELEKVFKHYGKNSSDSLKLRAAEFLIVNIPGKYSAYYDAPWNDVATVHLRWTSSSDKRMVLDTYQLGNAIRKEDIHHITADYLINNIELAFKVWEEMPWGKTIPFDVFCEEILPYRVGFEPLENWREKVLASFADIYSSLKNDTVITTVEACCKVNDLLPRFRMDKDFPPMSYSQLMASSRGVCDRMAELAVFAMRGLGIPVTFDFTPKRPFSPVGTAWNTVRDIDGKHHIFMGAQTNPGTPYSGATSDNIKSYRLYFGKQQNLALNKSDIPPLLHNIENIVDVTSETDGFDIWTSIPDDYSNQNGLVYLAILNGMEWHPISWGTVNEYNLEFNAMRAGLYLPVYYQNGIQTPIGNPFNYHYRTCHYYSPHSSRPRLFKSIAPGGNEWLQKMNGGKFEVSNDSNFMNSKTIHSIETTGLGFNTIHLEIFSAYRYIRYVAPKGERCNVSILDFYDGNGKKLEGKAIGTSGISSTCSIDKVFDGDVDTYFESTANPSWVGLDFGESRQISKIRYLPRTGGNYIFEGHVYELFCWNGTEWKSFGRKTADSNVLQYNAPANALYFLKNITKNKMHKTPFTIEYNSQQWFSNH